MSRQDDGEIWLGEFATEDETSDGTPMWQRAVLGVVGFLYLVTAAQGVVVVIGDLLGWASDSFWTWAGSTTSSGREQVRDDVLGLTVRSSCVAAVGVVLGWWWRRRAVLAVSAVGVVAALVVGLLTYWIAAEDQPEREDRAPVCQEYSGGDTRCPGG